MLIINADDFGINVDTNEAIVRAFSQKLCSSTTIIVNGEAFQNAVILAKENGLIDKIGIHINLVEFKPLTDEISRNLFLCDEYGYFRRDWKNKYKPGFFINKAVKQTIISEVKSQIEVCLSNGIVPTHVDSHSHAHTLPEVGDMICQAAKEYHIQKIRISRNCGKIPLYKRVYKYCYNNRLRIMKFNTTDYFGSIDDVIYLHSVNPNIIKDKKIEIMCHPRKLNDKIVDLNGISLYEQISKITDYTSAMSYYEL